MVVYVNLINHLSKIKLSPFQFIDGLQISFTDDRDEWEMTPIIPFLFYKKKESKSL